MDSGLELTTRINAEPGNKPLYSWCIEEYDEEGRKLDDQWIHWPWSLYFKATGFRRIQNIYSAPYADTPGITEREFITSNITSIDGEFRRPVSFSFFGTRRKIEQMTLQIQRLPLGTEEQCRIYGILQYSHERNMSSRAELTPDELAVSVYIASERYDRLLDALGSGEGAEITLKLAGVPGFYARWSPDIVTNAVKVLTSDKDQRPISPEGCDIDPAVTSDVKDFGIYVSRIIRSEQASSEPALDDEMEQIAAPPAHQPWVPFAAAINIRLDRLKVALWLLIGATLLALFFGR